MKPTLLILAAGMGSRYGGLKQLDGVGPGGETIMDYSVYDAMRAGFGKVVFVIRESFERDFREKIIGKYESLIAIDVVFQSLDALPAGFTVPEGREKPWGTNHAVLMGKDVIREPFAVINADDFYGRESFETLCRQLEHSTESNEYCMVGFRIGNTLSESGGVSRGICSVDSNDYLTGMTERKDIRRIDGRITFTDENGTAQALEEDTPVSMNMFGFTPDYFSHSEAMFHDFLRKNSGDLKSEYYIPLAVNELITNGTATMKVLNTASEWFGVTYMEDRSGVVAKLAAMTASGEYPVNLWK